MADSGDAQPGLAPRPGAHLRNRAGRRYTGGVREFEVAAKNLRGVIKALDKLYPGLGAHLKEETTVAIDSKIH
jgi:hypothetical protein